MKIRTPQRQSIARAAWLPALVTAVVIGQWGHPVRDGCVMARHLAIAVGVIWTVLVLWATAQLVGTSGDPFCPTDRGHSCVVDVREVTP